MADSMQAGKLREKVMFQRRSTSPDGFGNEDGAWSNYLGPVSARIRPINGREEVLAGKLAGVQPFEVTVRYMTQTRTLTPDDRVLRLGADGATLATYQITAVQNPDERHIWLSLLVKAGGDQT